MAAFARAALVVAAAAALFTIACPPYAWAAAAWVVPGLLFGGTARLRPAAAGAAGALFGVLIGAGITHWAYHATLAYFGADPWKSGAFVLLVWLVYSGFPCALLVTSWAVCRPRVSASARPLVAAWLWVVSEIARGLVFTGMPWELLGHTQFAHRTLVQIADLGGVEAVSFVIALVSVTIVDVAVERRGIGRLVVAAGVLVATLVYGAAAKSRWAPGAPGVRHERVAVVQANIPSEFLWKRAFFERTLATYAALSPAGPERPDLVVWPENAANFYLDKEPFLLAQLGPVASVPRDGLLLGGPRLAADGAARNSAYLLGAGGRIADVYDKRRLVPLAEYDPFERAPADGEPRYRPGFEPRVLRAGDVRLGPAICYEILFPGLVRDLVQRGAEILVNISNDSWLDGGDGAAPAQHLSMAVFRAVETRRFLVRAATTGVSGFVDPTGRIFATVPSGTAGAAVGDVEARRELTPYVRWGETWIVVVGLALATTPLVGRWRRLAA